MGSGPGAVARRVGKSRWFASFGRRFGHRFDLLTYSRTAGRVRFSAGLPTLMLTTRGRRTGDARTVPLLFVRDGSALVVVGSNWGQPQHPAWSTNLLATPEAVVQLGAEQFPVRAQLMNEPERERLWPRWREMWPAYDAYRERAGRELRMFRLEPIRQAAAAPAT